MNSYHEMYLKLAAGYEEAITAMAGAAIILIEAKLEAEDILLRSDNDLDQSADIKTLLRPDEPAEQC